MSTSSRLLAVWAIACALATSSDELPVSLATSFHDKQLPRWENGHLLAWGFPPGPVAWSFNREGKLHRQTTIAIPHVSEIQVGNSAISRNGFGAVSGGATGWGAFLAWISPTGAVERVVRTTPFANYRLAYADDDTLWVLGRLLADPPGSREELPHDVLRQYGRDGQLLRTMLPRNSFPRHDDWRHPATGGFLVVSKDRIGVYSGNAKEFVEVSARTGEVLGRWPGVAGPGRTRVTGAALTASGAVYVSADHGPTSKPEAAFYRLDRDAGVWSPVNRTESGWACILGADGDNLVVKSGLADLLWVPAG